MFRGVLCLAVCALSLVTMSSASAQSGARSNVLISGKSAPLPSAPLGPPTSLTQPYEPRAASAVLGPGLLVDDASARAAAAPADGITVTSLAPLPRTAASDLAVGRPIIVVTDGKGTGRE